MVAVMRNANFEKKFKMHSHKIDPEMIVVTADAVMDTPMIIRACCTRASRVTIYSGAFT